MRPISVYTLLIAPMVVLSIITHAFAGAWTQSQGTTDVTINNWLYSAQKFYDTNGKLKRQTSYRKYELNPYIEYGLRDDITLGANLFFTTASQGNNSHYSLGDSEFFLRKRLWQSSDGWVISAEPMFKLPSPSSRDRLPAIGSKYPDVGLGLSVGYGWRDGDRHHYLNLDSGYRYRFGDLGDQYLVTASAGIEITPKWMILPQAFATLRSSQQSRGFTQSSGDDYDLLKVQLSAVYRMTDTTSLQVGAFTHAYGRNAGAGNGVLVAVRKQW